LVATRPKRMSKDGWIMGENRKHDSHDGAEKQELHSKEKAPHGTPIHTSKDNTLHKNLEHKITGATKRGTGPQDTPFTIDMGDGTLVQDRRPLRDDGVMKTLADVKQTMKDVQDLVKAGNRRPDSEHAMKKILDDIAKERKEHPKEFKAYLDLLNKTIAHEPGISNALMPGTKFVDADMKGCVYGENSITHNKFVYANESGRLVAIEDEDRNHIRRVWDIHGHPLRVDKMFDDGSKDVYQNAKVYHYDAHGKQTKESDIGAAMPTLLNEKYGNDLMSKLPDKDVAFAGAQLLKEHLWEFKDRTVIAQAIMNSHEPAQAMAAALAFAFTENKNRDLNQQDIDGMFNDSSRYATRASQIREMFKKGSIDTDHMPTNLEALAHIKQGQLPNCSGEAVLVGLASTAKGRAILAGGGDTMPIVQKDVNDTYIITFPGDKFDNFHINKPTLGERMIYSSCDGGGLYPAIIDKALGERILLHMDFDLGKGRLADETTAAGTPRDIIPGVATHFPRDNSFALRLFSQPNANIETRELNFLNSSPIPIGPLEVPATNIPRMSDADIEQAITRSLQAGKPVTADTAAGDTDLTIGNTRIKIDGSHQLTILRCQNGEVTLCDPHGFLVDEHGARIPGSTGVFGPIPVNMLRQFLHDINFER